MSKIEEVKLINPITGLPVDEIITEDEATKRGYFEYEFLLRYLEDDNEFIKYFVVDGKKIVVDLKNLIYNTGNQHKLTTSVFTIQNLRLSWLQDQ